MTHSLVSGYSAVRDSPNRMVVGQGFANLFSALFVGGMGGGAMVGQSVINNVSGGQSGLSSFVAGVTLLLIVFGAYPAAALIPLSAISGIMMYAVS